MDTIVMEAQAKINLALDVLNKRADGYHNLRMVMQSVELHDEITIQKTKAFVLRLKTNAPLPTDKRNLAYAAAAYCQEEFKLDSGLDIQLKKTIPIAAGLAGGSSDCAAVLLGIDRLFELRLPFDRLAAIGKKFGADVPFCLMSGTVLAEGIGDALTPLSALADMPILIVKPPFAISTADVFQAFRPERVTTRPDIAQMYAALARGDARAVAAALCNVLESVSLAQYPIIEEIKQILLAFGAMGALMSGSGPSVFGCFDQIDAARRAREEIQKRLPQIHDVFLTAPTVSRLK
jgi:4-diphosphocytidyl-2-C-methyl-D-erythritol kinase